MTRVGADENVVLVTIARVVGSAPREAGTKMVVAASYSDGSIGGGVLEYEALGFARALLQSDDHAGHFSTTLGPGTGQCCGGVVDILCEVLSLDRIPERLASQTTSGESLFITEYDLTRRDTRWNARDQRGVHEDCDETRRTTVLKAIDSGEPKLLCEAGRWILVEPGRSARTRSQIVVFGAGHVGRALVNVLQHCDCDIVWLDSRVHEFPDHIAENVKMIVTDAGAESDSDLIGSFSVNSVFVAMTHSHPIDYGICSAVLSRGEFGYLGVIGSKTKAARFRQHLLADGHSDQLVNRMKCPIGLSGIGGKLPGEIAIAVAAELLSGGKIENEQPIEPREGRTLEVFEHAKR